MTNHESPMEIATKVNLLLSKGETRILVDDIEKHQTKKEITYQH
jgi:hypothetical protein